MSVAQCSQRNSTTREPTPTSREKPLFARLFFRDLSFNRVRLLFSPRPTEVGNSIARRTHSGPVCPDTSKGLARFLGVPRNDKYEIQKTASLPAGEFAQPNRAFHRNMRRCRPVTDRSLTAGQCVRDRLARFPEPEFARIFC